MKITKHESKGFTLVELIVVIVIIAVLAAIAIPALTSFIDKSKDKVLLANTSDLARYIQAEILFNTYDNEAFDMFTYKKSGDGNDNYLSTYLEVNWGVLNGFGDEDDDNILGLKNPVSGKIGVVNYTGIAHLPDFYLQQALYITRDSDAAYTPGTRGTLDDYYKGAVVMWYNGTNDANSTKIYLYYVSVDGKQSEKYYLYEKGVI